jgi:hypothetical protein
MRSGEVVPRDAVVVSPRLAARAGILSALGLETTELPLGLGEHVESDAMGLTAVPGVWVAGNVTIMTNSSGRIVLGLSGTEDASDRERKADDEW